MVLTPPCLAALLNKHSCMGSITNSDPQWRNIPVGLTPEQVSDPYIVLEWFFYPADYLPVYRNRLKRWLIAAIDGKHKWTRNKLVRCIYGFYSISNLLEAFWIIYQRGDNFNKEELELRGDYDDKELMWSVRVQYQMQYHGYNEQSFQPEFISYEEEMAPFSVINQLFKDQDLFDIKQQLDRVVPGYSCQSFGICCNRKTSHSQYL